MESMADQDESGTPSVSSRVDGFHRRIAATKAMFYQWANRMRRERKAAGVTQVHRAARLSDAADHGRLAPPGMRFRIQCVGEPREDCTCTFR